MKRTRAEQLHEQATRLWGAMGASAPGTEPGGGGWGGRANVARTWYARG